MIQELLGFPVFWVIGGLTVAGLLIILFGAAQRFPATVASLLTVATILAGFAMGPTR